MAIATLSGTFLRPTVSANKRVYTKDNISKAVNRLQSRLDKATAEGKVLPVTMLTGHPFNTDEDVTKTAAILSRVSQNEKGEATFEAKVPDTSVGRDIAALAVPDAEGRRYVSGVSIRGRWLGEPKTDEGGLTSAPDLEVLAIDFTNHPGVEGAQITDARLGESELSAGVFTESIDPVGFTEAIDEPLPELEEQDSYIDLILAGESHPFDGGVCTACTEADKEPYGDVTYADPGYQKDKKKRYPIDTKEHVRAAWSYINKGSNASQYSAAQLKRVKSRIKTAAKKFGVDISGESAQLASVVEQMRQEFNDVIEAWSSISLDSGPGSVHVSARHKPADVNKVGAVIVRAALAGISHLSDLDDPGDLGMDGESTQDGDGDDDLPIECVDCGDPLGENAHKCAKCNASETNSDKKEETTPMPDENQGTGTESGSGTEQKTLAETIAVAVGVAVAEAMKASVAPPEPPKELTMAEQFAALEAKMVNAIQEKAVETFRSTPTRKGLAEQTTPDDPATLRELDDKAFDRKFAQAYIPYSRASALR